MAKKEEGEARRGRDGVFVMDLYVCEQIHADGVDDPRALVYTAEQVVPVIVPGKIIRGNRCKPPRCCGGSVFSEGCSHSTGS